MFSKLAFAAGLLGTTLAQSTVTSEVYSATVTVNSCATACPSGSASGEGAAAAAVGSNTPYTVVVNNGMTTIVGSGAPAGATAASTSSSCGFALAVNGTTTLQQISDGQIQAQQAETLGQISDGQVQSGAGLTSSSFTISNGMVYDQAGRICSISGQAQNQFQCNYVPTTNSTTTTFSLVGMNLAFNGNTQFYACLLGADGEGYNIYESLNGNQNSCSPIVLTAIGSTDCGSSSAVAQTTAAAAVAKTAAAVVTTAAAAVHTAAAAVNTAAPVASEATSAVAAGSTSAAALPVVSSLPSSTSGGSIASPRSAAGLVLAMAFSYFML